jgi:hypothetical protein
MKYYKIYSSVEYGLEAIKQGISFPAFFFTVFWAAYNKMWEVVLTALYFIIPLELLTSLFQTPYAFNLIINLIIAFVFGSYGNEWKEKLFTEKGYTYQVVIAATNKKNAIKLYQKL